jgi:hypothetical protein
MLLQESGLAPMGDAPSAFACLMCFEPLSKEDQVTLCDGEADDPLNEVDCPSCGDIFDITGVEVRIHPDATPLLSLDAVMETEWFHVSWSSDWHNSLMKEEDIPFIHAGNKQSALDRYDGLYKGCIAYLYKFSIDPNVKLSGTVYDDLNEWPPLVSDASYFRGFENVDGIRYVNRWESPGSISLLVNPQFLVNVTCEKLLIEENIAA